MRLIIAGGRHYRLTKDDQAFIANVVDKYQVTEIVQGGAKGADLGAKLWAKANGIKCTEFPAEWTKYGDSAGMIRNREMGNYADALLAFPGGIGTAGMIKTAERLKLLVIIRK